MVRILVFLLFSLPVFLSSQTPAPGIVDSLLKIRRAASNPKEEISALTSLVNAYWKKDNKIAGQYIKELLESATTAEDPQALGFGFEKQAGLNYFAGDLEAAKINYGLAASHYQKAEDFSSALQAEIRTGVMDCLQGKYAHAEAIFRRLLPQAVEHQAESALAFLFNQMGTLYHYQGISDSTILYYKKSEQLYGELRDTLAMLRPMFNHAVLLNNQGETEAALEVYLRIKEIQEKFDSPNDLGLTLMAISNSYKKKGLYNESLKYNLEALELFKKVQDDYASTQALYELAQIHQLKKEYDKALELLEQAQLLAEKADSKDLLIFIHSQKTRLYIDMKAYEEAKASGSKALELIEESGSSRFEADVLTLLAKIHLKEGNVNLMLPLLEKATRLAEERSQQVSLDFAHYILSAYYLEKKQPQKAISYAIKSYEGNKKSKNINSQIETAQILAKAYKQLGQFENALEYTERYTLLNDSLQNIEKLRSINQQLEDYEARLAKQEAEALKKQQEMAEKAKENRLRLIVWGIILLFLTGLLFLLVTYRKNKIIENQNKQLQQLNKTKDQVLTIVGHDLRQPAIALRDITKKVHYLLKKRDFETLEKLAQEIDAGADAFNSLTENLLQWALLQKKGLPARPERLALQALVGQTIAFFEPIANGKNIELTTSISETLSVFADKNALQTIVRNLTENALKFTPEGGKVQWSAQSVSEARVQIEITDTGIGMTTEQIENIFIFDAIKSTAGLHGERGAGLGLHLVYELVKSNKGSIKVESAPNQGATFQMEFPAIAASK